MARDTDFIDLYRILDLEPGCGLDDFKRAYRRRVSVLHPDRRDNHPGDAVAARRLQQLTAMYGMAMEFQRQHGRLPGAPQARPNPQTPLIGSTPSSRPPIGASRQRRLPWWLILPGTVTIVWLLWPGELPLTTSPS
ncbi:MAG: J domain-containing protein, partial [Dokdonella sp.]